MIYCAVVIVACAATIWAMWLIGGKKGFLKGEPILRQKRAGTYWLNALIWAAVLALMFGDPIVTHNVNLALWGEAAIFFAVFFISIFLDQRTRIRGIMALAASIDLGVFYLIYLTVP